MDATLFCKLSVTLQRLGAVAQAEMDDSVFITLMAEVTLLFMLFLYQLTEEKLFSL